MATPNEMADAILTAIDTLQVNNGALKIINGYLVSNGSNPVTDGIIYNQSVISALQDVLVSHYENK